MEDFHDMEKERIGRRYNIGNLSKQERCGKIRYELLAGFRSRGREMRKVTREKPAVPNYDGWMREQGWVRNFDGFWERRDGRYWEKMQYYEKYREWEMELTEEREENQYLERGCDCKAKSREIDWNRYERGYDSNEMKIPRKSRKRSISAVRSSDIVKYDDGVSQKQATEANQSDSLKKLKGSFTGKKIFTEKKIAHSDPDVNRKVSKDSKLKTDKRSKGTHGIENVPSTLNTFELQSSRNSQRSETCGNGSKPDIRNQRSRSLNLRFASLCQNSETSFAEVNVINMEVTIVNDLDKDIHEGKETTTRKDSLEQRRMKCSRNKDVFVPTDDREESLPTDEGKETTESSAENDESSKESDTDAEESNEAMKSSKRPQDLLNSNLLQDDSNEVLGREEFDQQNCLDQSSHYLDVTKNHMSFSSKDKMDTDMIDLNVSQDLFKTAQSVSKDQQISKADSGTEDQDEKIGNEIPDVKKLEQKVLSIELQIAELHALRAKL